MASRNADSHVGQGEFGATKPRDEPMTTKGHAIGSKHGDDAVPTFSAQTLPAGSAPSDRTFEPNTSAEVPGQANNPDVLPSEDSEGTYTSASDTLGGASSADVHKGYGQPTSGAQVSDRQGDERTGLAGVGGNTGTDSLRMQKQMREEGAEALEKGT